jgi:hypothetical protein
MPPNSTQNLNAKLSLTTIGQRRSGSAPSFAPRLTQSAAPAVKVFSGPRQYRGGYYLNV